MKDTEFFHLCAAASFYYTTEQSDPKRRVSIRMLLNKNEAREYISSGYIYICDVYNSIWTHRIRATYFIIILRILCVAVNIVWYGYAFCGHHSMHMCDSRKNWRKHNIIKSQKINLILFPKPIVLCIMEVLLFVSMHNAST